MSRSTIPSSMISDWFNVGKDFQRYTIESYSSTRPPRPLDGGSEFDDDDDSSSVASRRTNFEDYGTSYAQKCQRDEERLALKDHLEAEVASSIGGVSSLHLGRPEELSSMGGVPQVSELLQEQSVTVYQKYGSSRATDTSLPINEYKNKIVNMININRVVVIQGETGSGKTTQVPQYILEHCMKENVHCNIVVTQPRRIAAISIAKRVCQEMGDHEVGGLVGYQIGLENVTSPDTRLAFVTTGVLLQKLITAQNLNDYTHIILDEIHERDQEMDFLLLVVRKFVRTVSKDAKVILMSATINTDKFANYFSVPFGDQLISAPVLKITGHCHIIHDFWIDELSPLGQLPELKVDDPKLTPEAVNLAAKLIFKFDEIERHEQKTKNAEFAPDRGTVLLFLPGLEEINMMHRALDAGVLNKWKVMMLHSSITATEQSRVFEKAEIGYRKIIIATNIAESSITVSDIKYVIDFCLTKNLECDPSTNYTWLKLDWASQNNMIQRRGRAGRVSTGRVYRMITREFYNILPECTPPEMQRVPLDKVVLQAKMLDIGAPHEILGLAMDPPYLSDIERTILTLTQVGALVPIRNERGIIDQMNGKLTFVGRVIVNLPIDVHLGKLLILGYIFGCLENCLIIAAGLSKKSIFLKTSRDYLGAYARKLCFAQGSFSDCMAIVNAYKAWQNRHESGYFNRLRSGKNEERNFCRRVGIEIGGINDVKKLVIELTARLENCNIYVAHNDQRSSKSDKEKDILILKLAIAGAFYPNYFTQGQLDERTIVRALNGKDPKCHVVLSNMPMHQGILYEDQLVQGVFGEMLQPDPQPEHDHTRVCFRLSSNHNFQGMKELYPESRSNDSQQLEGITLGVYLAVKMRLLRTKIPLTLYPTDVANQMMAEIEREREEKEKGGKRKSLRTARMVSSGISRLQQVELPNMREATIDLAVTSMENCAKFWAHYTNREAEMDMRRIATLIDKLMATYYDSRPSTAMSMTHGSDRDSVCSNRSMSSGPLSQGRYCLAPFKEHEITYHRARIESIFDDKAEVFFVDYGNKETVTRSELRVIEILEFSELMKIPMQAFRCELSNLGPCAKKCPTGNWSIEAYEYFFKYIKDKKFIGRVYSVVHDVVHLELIHLNENGVQCSLNEDLKKKEFAVHKEEGYLSKQSNAVRKQASSESFMSGNYEEPTSIISSTVPKGPQLNSRGSRTIYVHGPDNPLEMSFMGLTRGTSMRVVRIEQDSVNSVALDPDPQDNHARLLVATDINLNRGGTGLTARSTTLMPNIHGLLSLVSLLFSPKVELRSKEGLTRYTGALCGLGYDEKSGHALFAEHDLEVVFDTLISDHDLCMINHTRMVLNCFLGFTGEFSEFQPGRMDEAQFKVRQNLLKLFLEERESIEPISFALVNKWGVQNPETELTPVFEGMNPNLVPVLAPISGIKLGELDVMEHIRYLHAKAADSQEQSKEYCQLCQVSCPTPRDLLKHLTTRSHKLQEVKLCRNESRHGQS